MTISLTLRRVNASGSPPYTDLGTVVTDGSEAVTFSLLDSPGVPGTYFYQLVASTSTGLANGDSMQYTNINLSALVIKR